MTVKLEDVLVVIGFCMTGVGAGMTWGVWAGLGALGLMLFILGLARAWRQAG